MKNNPEVGTTISQIPSNWSLVGTESNQFETIRTFHTATHVVDVDQDDEVVFSQPHNERPYLGSLCNPQNVDR